MRLGSIEDIANNSQQAFIFTPKPYTMLNTLTLKRIFFLCSALFSITLNAQVNKAPVKLNLSQEMKEPNNTSLDDYIGEDDMNYYILRAKYKVGFGGYHADYILESHN